MVILDNLKKCRSAHSKNIGRHVFRLSKITIFEGVFGFYNEGTPYFDCVKADDFR